MDRAERLSFRDRVVVVTGSGSGLGRAYALALASRGACVVVNGRREARVQGTVEQIRARGGRALPCVLDVSEKGAGEALVARTTDTFGRLDAVVNNAGVGHVSGAEGQRQPRIDFQHHLFRPT